MSVGAAFSARLLAGLTLVTLTGGCGSGSDGSPKKPPGSTGPCSPGQTCPGEPLEPRADGCQAPPSEQVNPLASYEWRVKAADYLVSSNADAGPGSLREALAAAQDLQVVGFDAAMSGKIIKLASELMVPASITLDATAASGVTLDGQGKTRIMSTARGKDTTFVGLRFVNGRTSGAGGALHVEQAIDDKAVGSVHILGCSFEHNSGGRGGALRIGWRIHGLVENSWFTDNDGSSGSEEDRGFSAGAISTSQNASLVVRRSRFDRNRGFIAGAVYNILQPVTVEDSVFMENVALGGSGAFFTDGGNGVGPDNDSVNGEPGEVTLRRVRMKGNQGQGAGGAVLIWGYPRDAITIENSVIQDSVLNADPNGESKGGGARLHALDRLVIRDSSVAGNRSDQQGGGLWIDGDGPLEIENVTFAENDVKNDQGGGFTYNGHGRVTIRNSLFAHNHAGRASGAFWFGDDKLDITVQNSIFAFNEADQDIGQRHVGYHPKDGGGNLEWVASQPDRGRVFENSVFADPLLGSLSDVQGALLYVMDAASPARDAATAESPERDARGAKREVAPDIGPFEAGAVCGQ